MDPTEPWHPVPMGNKLPTTHWSPNTRGTAGASIRPRLVAVDHPDPGRRPDGRLGQASMRPRLVAVDHEPGSAVRPLLGRGFNEATACCRGSLDISGMDKAEVLMASMRPRLVAVDHFFLVNPKLLPFLSFNEATACCRGSLGSLRQNEIRDLLASMRPRLVAVDHQAEPVLAKVNLFSLQ